MLKTQIEGFSKRIILCRQIPPDKSHQNLVNGSQIYVTFKRIISFIHL